MIDCFVGEKSANQEIDSPNFCLNIAPITVFY